MISPFSIRIRYSQISWLKFVLGVCQVDISLTGNIRETAFPVSHKKLHLNAASQLHDNAYL